MWVTLIFVSGPSGGADDVSFRRAPERLLPLHVEACPPSFFLCNITGSIGWTSRGRKAVAAAPMCEQEIGQMHAYGYRAPRKSKDSEGGRGLVSIFEKTKRISGVSWSHAGSHRKRDARPDWRSHDRRGNLVVDADYGCRNQVRGHGKSQRRESVVDRSAYRQRL
jgi:hypothetical protein